MIFGKSIALVFNETTNYDLFYLVSRTEHS